MSDKDLKSRTKKFTLNILDIVDEILYNASSKVIIYQISNQELLLVLIIEPLVELGVIMNFYRK